MAIQQRDSEHIVLKWAANATTSNVVALNSGCFGTLIVPSSMNALTLQVVTELAGKIGGEDLTSYFTTPSDFTGVNLLSTAKTLATGANAFTTDELRQIGGVTYVRFVLSASSVSAREALLYWKS